MKSPALDLLANLNTAFAARDVPLHGEPKRALFRVNRDVRFAHDKSPYKTNVSGVLTHSGDKRDQGLFYIQHGLSGSFAAAGFYALDPSKLAAFRARIAERAEDWRVVMAKLDAEGLALSREGAAARLPRGFKADDVGELADDLKLKSFTVSRPLSARDLAAADLPEPWRGRLDDASVPAVRWRPLAPGLAHDPWLASSFRPCPPQAA